MSVEVRCLLLSTVNCREQSLCFQAISRVLAHRFGWAGSSALRWISLTQKELLGAVFYISQNTQYSCLHLFLLEHMLLYQQHPPSFSTSIILGLPLHVLFQPYKERSEGCSGAHPLDTPHHPFPTRESCFPPIRHETLWYLQFPRQNCQRVPGRFSLFLYKLVPVVVTVSGTHCHEQPHKNRGSLALHLGGLQRGLVMWTKRTHMSNRFYQQALAPVFSVFPHRTAAFCGPFQKHKFSCCFQYEVCGSELKSHLLHAFVYLPSETSPTR